MRRFVPVAAVVTAVAALLIGGWLLFASRDHSVGAPRQAGVAPTTSLPPIVYSSETRSAPEPLPALPMGQVTPDGRDVRIAGDGRQLLVALVDGQCGGEEARLLGEYPDRVELELHPLPAPFPTGATIGPDGKYAYGCMSFGPLVSGPHAVIDLHDPIGKRKVVLSYRFDR